MSVEQNIHLNTEEMTTKDIFLSAVLSVLIISTKAKASDVVNNKSVVISDFSDKIQYLIGDKLELTKEMDDTYARIKCNVDVNGSIFFSDVNYFDKKKASEMEQIVHSLNIEPAPLEEGAYLIDVKFLVR
jgi:hypothetical protein